MINFGDKNILVQYIQNFLKDNLYEYNHLSDEYDLETHKALIKYLRLPEILDSQSMKDLLIEKFTFRETEPPNKLIDGGGIWNFDFEITPDIIKFYNRDINQCYDGAISFISNYIDEVRQVCKSYGWNLINYSRFNNNTKDTVAKIVIIIKKDSRKQLLPCKDIINMINFSTNEYILEKCFIDDNNSYHGMIQHSDNFKIHYIEAKPGDVFTIMHGYDTACEIAISYSNHTLSEIKSGLYTNVNNIVSRLNNSAKGLLNPNEYETYYIPANDECKYLLIQLPYNKSKNISQKTTIKIGDINQDGIIDYDENNPESDYMLLKRYVEALELNKKPPFELSGIKLLAANINKDIDNSGRQVIDRADLNAFKSAIMSNKPINFGEINYEKKSDTFTIDSNKLLIMYGDINFLNNNNELNIPINEYRTNPWVVHECFLPYILNSTIHSYSHIQDIEWLQLQIQKLYPDYKITQYGYYDTKESFNDNDYFIWNSSKSKYEYYQNNLYSGYILDTNNLSNGNLINEQDLSLTDIKIHNYRIYVNNQSTTKTVTPYGMIIDDRFNYNLKTLVKAFQIQTNAFYKNNSKEQIKFITGYLDPLTEKHLKQIIYNLDNV